MLCYHKHVDTKRIGYRVTSRIMYNLTNLLILFSIASISCFLVPDGRVSVLTNKGEIIGFNTLLRIKGTNRVVQKFLGIPYAESPTGSNRFRKPIPKAVFKTAFDATKYGPACYPIEFSSIFNQSATVTYGEDCLRLNIFAPESDSLNVSLPVMVWIHGGGFVLGSSNGYDSGPLSLSGDVIVVTINYRLNVFGFLSTSDSNAAGNWGLWDQQLAIKWVHDNIPAFGGDPTKVAIFGESAGSASVVYQTIYPGNKGLFQRAIAESGSIQSYWAFNKQQEALNLTKEFATLAGCNKLDSLSIVTCLQSKTPKQLFTLVNDANVSNWRPVIDGQFIFDDPKLIAQGFPSKQVEDMFRSVDLIIGVNNKEGLVNFYNINETTKLNFSKSQIDNDLIPNFLKQFGYTKENLYPSVKAGAVLEYTDWDDLSSNSKQFDRFIDMLSDISFNIPTALTAQTHAGSPTRTFVYKLSTAPAYRVLPVYSELDGPTVADHGDDISFLFGPWFLDDMGGTDGQILSATNEQINVAKAMITMWTNFAKTG